jgi:putative tricarboxylic transport membrane protein
VTADRAAAGVLCLLGVGVSLLAMRLPYWIDRAPGPGFLPFWLGVILAVASAAAFFRTRLIERTDDDAPLLRRDSRSLQLAAITTGAVAIVPFVGLVLATGLLTAAASWRMDPRRPVANAAASILTPAVVWLVFVRWLGIPLP